MNLTHKPIQAHWHIACRSKELNKTPLAVIIPATYIVVFRTASSQVAALEDRCAHRNTPLSKGKTSQE